MPWSKSTEPLQPVFSNRLISYGILKGQNQVFCSKAQLNLSGNMKTEGHTKDHLY